jgi:hypothetical protein
MHRRIYLLAAMLRPLRDEAFCCLLLCDVALAGRASEEGLPAQARDGVGAGTGTGVALPLLLRGLRLALRESELLGRRDCPCRLVLRSSRPCDALSLVASRLRLRCYPCALCASTPRRGSRGSRGRGGCMGRRICLARGRRESRRQSRGRRAGESDVRQLLRAVVLGQGVRAAIPATAIPVVLLAVLLVLQLLALLLLLQVRVPLVWVLLWVLVWVTVYVTVTPWGSWAGRCYKQCRAGERQRRRRGTETGGQRNAGGNGVREGAGAGARALLYAYHTCTGPTQCACPQRRC